MRKYFFLCLVIFVSFNSDATAIHLFKKSDIDHLIGEMTQEHVQKHQVNGEFLKNAFSTYFEQFDPDKIYLLDRDLTSYLHLNAEQQRTYLQQYQQHDYSVFNAMNQLIVRSILRARANREMIFSNAARYLNLAQKQFLSGHVAQSDEYRYALSETELNQRQVNHFMNYLVMQMEKFGDVEIMKNREHTVAVYKDAQQDLESRFFGVDIQNKPLTKEHKEHIESLLILKALAKSLDSHTAFFDSSEASTVRARLEKEYIGIGIIFEERADGIAVKEVVAGSSASADKKIKVGDRLTMINGNDVTHEAYASAMEMLEGEKNEKVQLKLRHEGQTEIYTSDLVYTLLAMQEDRVKVNKIPFRDGTIAMLTLNTFYQGESGVNAENDLLQAINQLKKEGKLLGLILDLRENSGGFLSQAVKVSGLFITNGVVVISKYGDGSVRLYRDIDWNQAFEGPLIILTSRYTASAAEIVAQALQDYGVALVVGDDRTYGKGTIQTQTVTNGETDTFFKVTVGKYYTVSGRTPQGTGVLADIVVPGEHMNEAIGERYLEHVIDQDASNGIQPEFNDSLVDVDSETREWYLRYYLPTLQKRLSHWHLLAPALRSRSQQRVMNNIDYQAVLKEKGYYPGGASVDMTKMKRISVSDLQVNEAFNIVKDMIELSMPK